MGAAITTGDRVYLPQLQTFADVTGWVEDEDNPYPCYRVRTEDGDDMLVPSWRMFHAGNVEALPAPLPHEWFARRFPMPCNDTGDDGDAA